MLRSAKDCGNDAINTLVASAANPACATRRSRPRRIRVPDVPASALTSPCGSTGARRRRGRTSRRRSARSTRRPAGRSTTRPRNRPCVAPAAASSTAARPGSGSVPDPAASWLAAALCTSAQHLRLRSVHSLPPVTRPVDRSVVKHPHVRQLPASMERFPTLFLTLTPCSTPARRNGSLYRVLRLRRIATAIAPIRPKVAVAGSGTAGAGSVVGGVPGTVNCRMPLTKSIWLSTIAN